MFFALYVLHGWWCLVSPPAWGRFLLLCVHGMLLLPLTLLAHHYAYKESESQASAVRRLQAHGVTQRGTIC
jgi:hypothetical protein